MKIVILAAGMGSRLHDREVPKPLTLLANGKSLLGQQLETIKEFISLDHVILVVGYQKRMIMDLFPDQLFVFNPDYAKENTAKSLLRALQKVNEDVIWINGDVVFHRDVFKKILDNPNSAMVVNVGDVDEEEVKYRSDPAGRIVAVSKTLPDAEGEALGINRIKVEHLEFFREHLKACHDGDYFEKGLEKCIQEGMELYKIQVEKELCVEVDFAEDLKVANLMLSAWAAEH